MQAAKRQRGFTLIELLVVIAIIAVLAALILAALSSAQKGSRDSKRRSDLHQYKVAIQQYHDETGVYISNGAGGPFVMSASTEPYLSLKAGGYMTAYLDSPPHASGYIYAGTFCCQNFAICTTLERTASSTNGKENYVVTPSYEGTGEGVPQGAILSPVTTATCTPRTE